MYKKEAKQKDKNIRIYSMMQAQREWVKNVYSLYVCMNYAWHESQDSVIEDPEEQEKENCARAETHYL